MTLTGKGIRLSEAVQQLQKQTGNAITDLREQLGAEVTNPALDLDLRDKPFFEALDQIARMAEVSIILFDRRRLDRHHGRRLDGQQPPARRLPKAKPLILYSGPFRIELQQVSLSRDFQTGTALANVRLEAAWEPRLRPMLLKLKADEMKIVDDRKKDVKPQVAAESDEVVIRPENPSAEINLNLEAPDRDAKKIASLLVKAEVTIPAGIKTFKFPSLAQKDVTVQQGDVEPDPRRYRNRRTSVEGERHAGLSRARGRLLKAIGKDYSTTGSGSSVPTARDLNTTADSTIPGPTEASSALSISLWTRPASRPITSSSTKHRAK